MRHKFYERQLSAFVDQELDARQVELVREHLEQCKSCQRRLQELGMIRETIRETASIALPEAFVYSVQRAVRREQQETVIWLGPERFARNLVAALCILVFMVIVFGSYFAPQQAVGVDRYLGGEPTDSAAHAVIGSQNELSKDDVFFAAVSR